MKLLLGSVFLLNIFCVIMVGQSNDTFPGISTKDFNEVNLISESKYDGSGLWGYINGGADIYLEYGFDKLLVQEIEHKHSKFKIEYYRMKNAAAAFGIYSVSIFKCGKQNAISKFCCITPYQIQSALGRFYISISNETGKAETNKHALELFSAIKKKCNEPDFVLSELLQKIIEKKKVNEIKYFRGKLGIQNGVPEWTELFEGIIFNDIYLFSFVSKYDQVKSAVISFANSGDMKKFTSLVNNKKSSGSKYKINLISSTDIIFNETTPVKSN